MQVLSDVADVLLAAVPCWRLQPDVPLLLPHLPIVRSVPSPAAQHLLPPSDSCCYWVWGGRADGVTEARSCRRCMCPAVAAVSPGVCLTPAAVVQVQPDVPRSPRHGAVLPAAGIQPDIPIVRTPPESLCRRSTTAAGHGSTQRQTARGADTEQRRRAAACMRLFCGIAYMHGHVAAVTPPTRPAANPALTPRAAAVQVQPDVPELQPAEPLVLPVGARLLQRAAGLLPHVPLLQPADGAVQPDPAAPGAVQHVLPTRLRGVLARGCAAERLCRAGAVGVVPVHPGDAVNTV